MLYLLNLFKEKREIKLANEKREEIRKQKEEIKKQEALREKEE
jgi:hypothetical protein